MSISKELATCALVTLGFFLHQGIINVIPVAIARKKTGIDAPTLYPRDSQIKELKVSDEDLDGYMRAQRAHQNNMEFLTQWMPIWGFACVIDPAAAIIPGALTLAGRVVTCWAYSNVSKSARIWGAWFHIPELYTAFYVVGYGAYKIAFN
jgi:hypothetical protein